jgi:ADP-heptose:LPS heptosyltransferase/SAM-dependent methyltransferase
VAWHLDDPQGNEAAKFKYEVVPYTRGIVLDLGCGPAKAFPHFIGVDSCKDTQLFGIAIKPDVTCDVADPEAVAATFHAQSVDAVFSSHCLEHIEDAHSALAAWWNLIKPGGHLVLYLPHKDLYPNIGTEGANPDHKHDFVPTDFLYDLLPKVCAGSQSAMDVLVSETRGERLEYSFLLVVRKEAVVEGRDRFRYSCHNERPAKTVCVSRFGGFGDMLQAANILPALKRAGYHVTVNTTPSGQNIIRHDPHVDEWLIQDPDQVPNGELVDFWEALSRRYDKFVQLSESVEGTLLALPGRANHSWPAAVRRQRLNVNYLEFTSELAELPYSSEAKFYPSEAERAEARAFVSDIVRARTQAKHGTDLMILKSEPVFVVLWALAGSSVHKFTPHQDAVIARVMLDLPEAVVVLSGDEACQILEQGWEYEPRVICMSGKQSIRQTLALAQQAHCVVGPETGVLNAVAFEPGIPKVLMLSHSSHENLSKHWANTVALSAPEDPTVPLCGNLACHQLHYGAKYCPSDAITGAAMCQLAISPARIYTGIEQAHAAWKKTTKEAA